MHNCYQGAKLVKKNEICKFSSVHTAFRPQLRAIREEGNEPMREERCFIIGKQLLKSPKARGLSEDVGRSLYNVENSGSFFESEFFYGWKVFECRPDSRLF